MSEQSPEDGPSDGRIRYCTNCADHFGDGDAYCPTCGQRGELA